ncbi:HD-GYP domain-containing protein, partial [Desulfovibrio sp.]
AGHLHDIGKIGVSDALLRKTGPLSVAEWGELRRHPAIGAQIVRPVRPLAEAGVVEMILHHHERFDGKGYPAGLAGASIPFGARVIALADSVSAMLQDRPYRPARTFERVVDEVGRCSGSQFDPDVARAFVNHAERFRALCHGGGKRETATLPARPATALAV